VKSGRDKTTFEKLLVKMAPGSACLAAIRLRLRCKTTSSGLRGARAPSAAPLDPMPGPIAPKMSSVRGKGREGEREREREGSFVNSRAASVSYLFCSREGILCSDQVPRVLECHV